jgi:putative ABC transport system ATP-binding protein
VSLDLVCHEITRVYRSPAGSVEALRTISTRFPAGAVSAVVGPSGCGKSTLLRVLAGVELPDAGSVEVGGLDLTTIGRDRLRRYRRETAAYATQRPSASLVPHLRLDEQFDVADGARLVDDLGLGRRLSARAAELSGGEQARAAIAVTLARRTPIVLVDEPTAELDHASATRVIDALEEVARTGRTVVVATHDPELIGRSAVRIELARKTRPALAPARPRSGTRETVMQLRNLIKSYAGARAVDGVTLALRRGELGVVIGRSGSGKSTLLMLAGGWLRPDAGVAVIPGMRRHGAPRWADTSYLPQRFGLMSELSVAENLTLPVRLAGTNGAVAELLERLELSTLADRRPDELSIGQQQRVALARALVLRPALVLADEPTSHQDDASAELVWQVLADACATGTACLLATHDEATAARADRMWRLADGRLEDA